MKSYSIGIPEGTNDRLYSECLTIKNIGNNLSDFFDGRGFSEVMTPSIEYYDVCTRPDKSLAEQSLIKLIDRSGRIIVLRPDCTTPIARIAATKLQSAPPPFRFYYRQNVFRSNLSDLGEESEIMQIGAELLGSRSMSADVEMLALAVDSLRRAGVPDFRIEIGHAGFFKSLASALGAESEMIERMRGLVERKNFAALTDLIKGFNGAPEALAIRKLPQLFGGYEVFSEALSLTSNRQATENIGYLKAIYDELNAAGMADHIMIDLGIVHKIDYYSGIIFRAYAADVGRTILSGGRYDNLASAFGRDLPAVGFAIDLSSLCESVPSAEIPAVEELVYHGKGMLLTALRYIESRPAGTAELSACDSEDEALHVALKKGIPHLVVAEENGISRKEASL